MTLERPEQCTVQESQRVDIRYIQAGTVLYLPWCCALELHMHGKSQVRSKETLNGSTLVLGICLTKIKELPGNLIRGGSSCNEVKVCEIRTRVMNV